MAIGQQLTAPEAGWKRYDDRDSRLLYNELCNNSTLVNYSFNNTIKYILINGGILEFKFYGSKLRLIGINDINNHSEKGSIIIDSNEEIFTQRLSPWNNYIVSYEKLNLPLGWHSVKITNLSSLLDPNHNPICLDAIDIDDTGYLLLPISVNLTATAGNTQVALSWDSVTSANGYNVKRATTAGGPYNTIANNVTATSYVDTDVVNGTTYCYVVTAITAEDESDNSNEASATPTAPPVEEGEAVLRVTMIDSSEREYKVSKATANDFAAWCNRAIGTGNSCYVFDKGIQDSKEYLFYEKIISFEVIPVA